MSGVKVATRPSGDKVIDPGMSAPVLLTSSCIEPVVTVRGLSASLNVNSTSVETATSVAPFGGVILKVVGRVISIVLDAEVVKLLLNGNTALPTRSVKPATSTLCGNRWYLALSR